MQTVHLSASAFLSVSVSGPHNKWTYALRPLYSFTCTALLWHTNENARKKTGKEFNKYYGVFTPEQDNDKTNVEHVHSYDAFHTRHAGPGVKGIIGMHRFNICLVVVLSLSCSGVKTPYIRSIEDAC